MAAGEVIGCFGLTEPTSGSDPASMQTRAVRDGDTWVINGAKRWICLRCQIRHFPPTRGRHCRLQ